MSKKHDKNEDAPRTTAANTPVFDQPPAAADQPPAPEPPAKPAYVEPTYPDGTPKQVADYTAAELRLKELNEESGK
jgi:hypothetical protein